MTAGGGGRGWVYIHIQSHLDIVLSALVGLLGLPAFREFGTLALLFLCVLDQFRLPLSPLPGNRLHKEIIGRRLYSFHFVLDIIWMQFPL